MKAKKDGGQSVNQVYINHEDELICSEKTIYDYIDACMFDVRNIDLPRKVKFRERYKKSEFKVNKDCRIGRNYEAFTAYMEKNPDTPVVQMDSVIGSKGGKCLNLVDFIVINEYNIGRILLLKSRRCRYEYSSIRSNQTKLQ